MYAPPPSSSAPTSPTSPTSPTTTTIHNELLSSHRRSYQGGNLYLHRHHSQQSPPAKHVEQFSCRVSQKRSIMDITPEWMGNLAPNRATFRRMKHVYTRLPSITMSPMVGPVSPLIELLQNSSVTALRHCPTSHTATTHSTTASEAKLPLTTTPPPKSYNLHHYHYDNKDNASANNTTGGGFTLSSLTTTSAHNSKQISKNNDLLFSTSMSPPNSPGRLNNGPAASLVNSPISSPPTSPRTPTQQIPTAARQSLSQQSPKVNNSNNTTAAPFTYGALDAPHVSESAIVTLADEHDHHRDVDHHMTRMMRTASVSAFNSHSQVLSDNEEDSVFDATTRQHNNNNKNSKVNNNTMTNNNNNNHDTNNNNHHNSEEANGDSSEADEIGLWQDVVSTGEEYSQSDNEMDQHNNHNQNRHNHHHRHHPNGILPEDDSTDLDEFSDIQIIGRHSNHFAGLIDSVTQEEEEEDGDQRHNDERDALNNNDDHDGAVDDDNGLGMGSSGARIIDGIAYEQEEEEGDEMIIHESVEQMTKSQRMIMSKYPTIQEQLIHLCGLPSDRGLSAVAHILNRISESTGSALVHTNSHYGARKVTPMHVAARMNNYQIMQLLINHGANVNETDAIKATPLHYACANNAIEAVCCLILNAADLNANDMYSVYPLLIAMRNNCLEIIKMLSLGRADVHMRGIKGDTCLHIASREGYLKRVKFLIEECSASVSRLNQDRENVLFSSLSNYSIVFYICEHVMYSSPSQSYKSLCKLTGVLTRNGRTVFHEAAANGYLKSLLIIIQALIKSADRVFMQSANDMTSGSTADYGSFTASSSFNSSFVSHHATSDLEDDGHGMKRVQRFLKDRLNEKDLNTGQSALHMAVIKGHTKIVKYLSLCYEVDVDEKDKKGNTALHYAIEAKNVEMCEILTYIGNAKITKKNANKKTAKSLASEAGIHLHKSTQPREFSLKSIRKTTTNRLFRSNP